LSQELVTFIVLGSKSRLKGIKLPVNNKFEEFVASNFNPNTSYKDQLDELITSSKGELIVLLPPSSFPNQEAKESLKKISLIGLSTWGWFEYSLTRKNIIQNLKKVSTLVRSIPDLEQGIYFTKRLYFSVGGVGMFDSFKFTEISKRLYSRIDPQKTLPALIIRTKNLKLD
tara:strand:- start:72 stop:584 length:513 start_codon:yes stop_codon:yes gene_type:complete